MSVIDIKELSKLYGFGDATTIALDSVNLRVNKGEFIAIMGPSGSGKSTLMNLIGLLDRPTTGSYKLNKKDVSRLRSNRQAKLRRDDIGFIFQNHSLLPRLTIIENVALSLAYKGVPPVTRLRRAQEALEQVGLADRQYYYPRMLSGGQIQKVAVARALIGEPSIILADEPTGNLDTESSQDIMKLLADIHRQGNTVLMVTHNPELTIFANRILYLCDGQIQYDKELRKNQIVNLADFAPPKKTKRRKPKAKPNAKAKARRAQK